MQRRETKGWLKFRRPLSSRPLLHAACLGLIAALGSCLAANEPLRSRDQGDAGSSGIEIDGGGGSTPTAPLDAAPHTILGIEPPHGPFVGGNLALIRGNGFQSNARVWFGGIEVPDDDVLALDASRLQVVVPHGATGGVDLVVQNGSDESTSAKLRSGYFYDAFYADPPDGPTAGGTLIQLRGQNTGWTEETIVKIDGQPCAVEQLVSAEELHCRIPPGTPGAKLVHTRTGESSVDVLDAFSYVNSNNGFQGGLSGDPLNGELTVLVFNDITGMAIEGASVIVGDSDLTALTSQSDGDGVSVIADESLDDVATVTVARSCFQPITFVDVPSDHLTVYLAPVLSAACGSGGSLPGGGGTPGRGARITGELVWESTGEFRRNGWTNVPVPAAEHEKWVAYVFRLASSPTEEFSLPAALNAITPASEGTAGFSFSLSTLPGNHSLYALAGIEDSSQDPPAFTAYAMGIIEGVSVAPGATREDVFISIDVPLDHALTLDVTGPTPSSRGPDRLVATAAIAVGSQGYALVPNGRQTRPLPLEGSIDFVGVPPLIKSLAGSRYVATARAVTGEAAGTPLSVVGLLTTTTTSTPIGADAFVEVPILKSPAPSGAWDGRELQLEFGAGGAPVDLTIVDIESGGGLINWRIVAPGAASSLRVPDLRQFEGDLGLAPGPLGLLVTAARLDDFSYSSLSYANLRQRGFRAYASDHYYASF